VTDTAVVVTGAPTGPGGRGLRGEAGILVLRFCCLRLGAGCHLVWMRGGSPLQSRRQCRSSRDASACCLECPGYRAACGACAPAARVPCVRCLRGRGVRDTVCLGRVLDGVIDPAHEGACLQPMSALLKSLKGRCQETPHHGALGLSWLLTSPGSSVDEEDWGDVPCSGFRGQGFIASV